MIKNILFGFQHIYKYYKINDITKYGERDMCIKVESGGPMNLAVFVLSPCTLRAKQNRD